MGTSFVLFTGFEIIIAALVIAGLKHEKKLIKFEDRLFSSFKALYKNRKAREKKKQQLNQRAMAAKEQVRLRTEKMGANCDIIPLFRSTHHVA